VPTNCVVCNDPNIDTLPTKIPGYIEGMDFEVFICKSCDASFVDTAKIDKSLYDKIYSNSETPGYSRYHTYCNEVKKQDDPLLYLSQMEDIYFPVYCTLKNKSNMNVLEVGCGLGYLTYAINKSGNNAIGIDISWESIKEAANRFGKYFVCSDINSFAKISGKKYDYIITTEVIEHVADVKNFISSFIPLLSKNGKILITTPNKDARHPKDIWQTDAPPIHLTWLGKKCFYKIAKTLNLKASLVNFYSYPTIGNNLMSLIQKRLRELKRGYCEQFVGPFLTKDLKIIPQKPYHSDSDKRQGPLKKFLKLIFVKFKPIRNLSNLIYYYILRKSDGTLVVLLEKNS
jgi:SAM-dependent methyltransferase